jgi:hypothetical protein
MVERQDIDALLISALYGELTPAEETRLATHLESHPADRTALADLTHARQIVRESRILQTLVEPPQSVSAMLMQEAARRAPKGMRDPDQQESWFARFVRSFTAHPAMAAAAMLVVVVGVATMVTREKGDHFADSTAPAMTVAHDPESMRAADSFAAGSSATTESPVAPPRSESAQGSGSADSFRVALDDGLGAVRDEKQGQDTRTKNTSSATSTTSSAPPAQNRVASEGGSFATKPDVARKGTLGPSGIELRSQQYAPKDFDDAPTNKPPANAPAKLAKEQEAQKKREAWGGEADGNAELSGNDSTVGGAAAGRAPGGAATGATGGAPSPVTTASPPPPPPAIAQKAEPRRDAPKPANTKSVDRAKAAAPAEDKASDPQIAWAREQHVALVNQVRKAAGIATTLSNRAPAYYQQNVETDRSVKDCIAYINTERERDAEQRAERARAQQAQKRAAEPPPKASPPAKATTSKPATTDAK